MDTAKNGGPAFPTLERNESWKHRERHEEPEVYFTTEGGMTLRDWFAGQVVGHLAHALNVGRPWSSVARDAFAIADAMLAARNKESV